MWHVNCVRGGPTSSPLYREGVLELLFQLHLFGRRGAVCALALALALALVLVLALVPRVVPLGRLRCRRRWLDTQSGLFTLVDVQWVLPDRLVVFSVIEVERVVLLVLERDPALGGSGEGVGREWGGRRWR